MKIIKSLKDAYSEAKKKKRENKISANLNLESVKDGQKKHKEKVMARELRREKKNVRILSTRGSLATPLGHCNSVYLSYQ